MTGRVDTAEGRRLQARVEAACSFGGEILAATVFRTWAGDNADGLLAAAEELDACRRDLAEERARTTRLTELNGALRDFYESWLAVQDGLIDFDLHTDAVERLKAAQKALDLIRAGTEQPA